METILGWFVGIYLLFYIPYAIYFNVMHFTCKWRCRKKKYSRLFNPCKEHQCRYAKYCEEYKRDLGLAEHLRDKPKA